MKSTLILAAVVALVFAAPALAAPTRHVDGSGTYVDNPGYTTAAFSFDATGSGTAASGTMHWEQRIPGWTHPYRSADADVVCIDVVGNTAVVVGRITSYSPATELHSSDLTFLVRDTPDGFIGAFGDSSYETGCNVQQWAPQEIALTSGDVYVQPENAPVAGNDSYTVDSGATLTVAAAAGVLANDGDPDGDALTAAIATKPAHGTVALSADGSFRYTPASGYSGPDSFTYKAGDGRLTSTATVSITVNPPADAQPPVTTIAVGTPDGSHGWYRHAVQVTIAADDGAGSGVAATRCVVDPASAPASFADLPATCSLSQTIAADGEHTIYAASVDAAGNVEQVESVSVRIDATSPIVSFDGAAATYTVDQQVSIGCSAVDPPPGSGLDSDTCAQASVDAVPAYALGLGTHTLSATARDNAGNVGTGSVTFDVIVTQASLESLIGRLVADKGTATSLVAKIAAGQVTAFDHEVDALTGKKISAADAATLKALAAAL